MKKKQRLSLLILICFLFSCVACVWAWLCAIYLLFCGIAVVPAFFLQMLIRRGGKEWNWLLVVHALILLGAAGTGGLIILLTENLAQMYGLLLAIIGGSALAGCLFELVVYLLFGKDESDEAQS